MTSKRYAEPIRPRRMRGAAARGIAHTAGRHLLRGPTGRELDIGAVMRFGLGPLGFVGVITWQMRTITGADRLRLVARLLLVAVERADRVRDVADGQPDSRRGATRSR